jgi:hypothetical protein
VDENISEEILGLCRMGPGPGKLKEILQYTRFLSAKQPLSREAEHMHVMRAKKKGSRTF